MAFKKDMNVMVIYPATQINGARIFPGKVLRVSGPAQAPLVTVNIIGTGTVPVLDFRGSTGKGLNTEAFIVDRSFVDFALKS